MKKNSKYLYIFFWVSIIVVIIVSSILSEKISLIIDKSGWVEHTQLVKNKILNVQLDLLKAENAQRGYLLTGNDSLLSPIKETQKSIFTELDTLRLLTSDNKNQQRAVVKLKKAVSQRYQILYQTLNAEKESQLQEFLKNASKGNNAIAEFLSLCNQMDQAENKLLRERTKSRIFYENEAPRYLVLILAISCIFLLISFFLIINAFRQRDAYQVILENKIKELNVASAEMEQIAFAVSHDLQEPLRKIRTFSDKLLHHYLKPDEEGSMILDKISVASMRMQELLSDLVSYTRITKSEEVSQQVNIVSCIEKAWGEFYGEIEKKHAVIKMEQLPEIEGYYKQLYILFCNLIDNSFKFSKPDTSPLVIITSKRVSGSEIGVKKRFIKITYIDNGIGFKNEYAEKIFVIFQKLEDNKSSISGKGIGLAICKRIMINHQGYITANSDLSAGATFNLYFPENT